ncbi:MAG: hypothetical protein F4220_08480 [Gammaproteobacteria bacterium]|nr:hypothetical protein [Gammaproteobacteria bacterium]
MPTTPPNARVSAPLARFPKASAYPIEWIMENEMGPNVLWLTEFLCEAMDLRPGMRVLDLGCGKTVSSVFLAREFGVQVWATDLWISASDNATRIARQGMSESVFPIHADARICPSRTSSSTQSCQLMHSSTSALTPRFFQRSANTWCREARSG